MINQLVDRLQSSLIAEGRLTFWALVVLCLVVGVAGGGLIATLSPLMAFGLVVLLIGGLMMLRSTQVGLLALIGVATLFPFGVIPVQLGFYPTFLDAVLLALFFVWLARVVTRADVQVVTSPLALPILAFILLAFFSFIAGTAYADITKEALRHFLEIVISICVFFVAVNFVRSRRQLEGIARAIILAGFAEALIGIVLYFLPRDLTVRLLSALRFFHYPAGWGVLRFVEDNPLLPMRAISTSIDPNVLGGTLIFVTCLTAPQLFARRPLLKRRWVGPILLTMLTCMVLTFSRGSFAGLGLALLFIGATGYRKLLLLIVIAGVIFLLLPQTQEYIQHLRAGVLGQDLATQMRFGEYKDAMILIRRYPWFGVGFIAPPDIDLYIGVSNLYLLIAEKMGLIGLSVFLLIMLVLFLQLWRAFKRMGSDSKIQPILLGLTAALIGVLVGGLSDHYLFSYPHSSALLWLYIGLTMAAVKLEGERSSDDVEEI